MDVRKVAATFGAVVWLGLVGCDGAGPSGDTDTDTDTDDGAGDPEDPGPGDEPDDDAEDPPPDDDEDSNGDTSPPDPSDGDGDEDGGSDETGAPEPESDCCEVRAEPSCEDDAVALCVCDALLECCVSGWSQACADIAAESCGACGGEADGCGVPQTIELDAADAHLSGTWYLSESQIGEGMIAVNDLSYGEGSVIWDVDVPCDDTWHVWVRFFDEFEYDSYYVRVDGEPAMGGVFEGDCMPDGEGYGWRELNLKDEFAPPCQYTNDPWAQEWTAGPHEIAFGFRESRAIARIVVTNDPAYVP